MPEAPVSPDDATARIAALEASLARAHAALATRDLLIDTLRGQIARLRRMQFGASSEKLGREIEQLELALEELETERDTPLSKWPRRGIRHNRRRCAACLAIYRARRSSTSRRLVPAPARTAAARFAGWA